MNRAMIQRLVLKDWYFNRWVILGYLAGGSIALALVGGGNEAAFFAGCILLVTVLISMGIHLAMATVVQERTQHTLPFVMALPISPAEYTTAKIVANLLLFVAPWLVMVLASIGVVAARAAIPDGMIPFVVLLLFEIFVGYCLIVAVALVSESEGWTIGAIVTTNLAFQGFMYVVSHQPAIAAEMRGQAILWSGPTIPILLAEIAAIAAILSLTFFFQSRKTDFV